MNIRNDYICAKCGRHYRDIDVWKANPACSIGSCQEPERLPPSPPPDVPERIKTQVEEVIKNYREPSFWEDLWHALIGK